MASISIKGTGLVGTVSADGFVTLEKRDFDAHLERYAELERALRDAQSVLQQAANRARIDGDTFREAALAAYRVLDPKTIS